MQFSPTKFHTLRSLTAAEVSFNGMKLNGLVVKYQITNEDRRCCSKAVTAVSIKFSGGLFARNKYF
jgi:hypothetical protein